jgi:hypothetical protein
MKLKFNFNIITLILIFYLISIIFFRGYFSISPTIPVYPNNIKEVEIVKEYIKNRTPSDVEFYRLTNHSISHAFKPYVNETIGELNNIIGGVKTTSVILLNKYLINRARPEQIDRTIKPLEPQLLQAQTPSFPAGHAYQAQVLYKYLSKKYPEKESLFKKIAYRCDICRIKAGIHYPSDGEYSRKLVDLFGV